MRNAALVLIGLAACGPVRFGYAEGDAVADPYNRGARPEPQPERMQNQPGERVELTVRVLEYADDETSRIAPVLTMRDPGTRASGESAWALNGLAAVAVAPDAAHDAASRFASARPAEIFTAREDDPLRLSVWDTLAGQRTFILYAGATPDDEAGRIQDENLAATGFLVRARPAGPQSVELTFIPRLARHVDETVQERLFEDLAFRVVVSHRQPVVILDTARADSLGDALLVRRVPGTVRRAAIWIEADVPRRNP